MPVVSRWMTLRAETVMVSWPKTRMKSVGVVARVERVTKRKVSSSSKSTGSTVTEAFDLPKFASKNSCATSSALASSATRPAARPAVSSALPMRDLRR